MNFIIFVLVGYQLYRSAHVSGRVTNDEESKNTKRETIQRFQNALCIMLLLGLTWTCGYFLLIRAIGEVYCINFTFSLQCDLECCIANDKTVIPPRCNTSSSTNQKGKLL